MFGIVGSGFGLYGYLPALVRIVGPQKIILPASYKAIIVSRHDLLKYLNSIFWVEDVNEVLRASSKLVLAVPPKAQLALVETILSGSSHAQYLYLEKPIAPNPGSSLKLLNSLEEAGIKVKIAYLFRYTDWGMRLIKQTEVMSNSCCIKLVWNFKAHHIEKNLQNWKGVSQEGGGILRFYGIHLLAILAEMGYKEAEFSSLSCCVYGSATQWQARFVERLLPAFEISMNISSEVSQFIINFVEIGEKPLNYFVASDPFEQNVDKEGDDRRISALTKYLMDEMISKKTNSWHKNVTNLWTAVESNSQYK